MPAHGRIAPTTTLSPVSGGQGTKGSIPERLCSRNHHHGVKASGGVLQRDKRLLGLEPHPPLASPFLGPRPVFEIKPRGLGLRGKPVPPGGFEQVERTR